MRIQSIFFLLIILSLASCRGDEYIIQPETDVIAPPEQTAIKGFYVLNEGNMGSNKATLDFFDYTKGTYFRNIYAEANPTVVKELGDVGNDIKIYGGKMYVVVNASNKVEVLDARTVKRIKSISVENGRYMTFANGKAYVSSYTGPIKIDPKAPQGKVLEIDTLSLSVTREVIVGFQPEEMAVVKNKLYVANSGGYRVPDYDRTISVVDLGTFKEIAKYDVAINLNKLKSDVNGDLYVTSRGDYYTTASNLFVVDSETGFIKKTFNLPVSDFTIVNDKLYYYSNSYSYNTNSYVKSYGIIDVKTKSVIANKLFDAKYESEIETPYGIMVNPVTGDLYITDAGNYVSTGYIYCFNKNGVFRWRTEGGNIPAHFTLLYK
ncbi:YncE family protein [Elizabethkingia meningoseptica]|uniref:YncE family protein n=1 Tax=Elizabethkingia meningoseptica TaxID=238 RepID=UPI0038918502